MPKPKRTLEEAFAEAQVPATKKDMADIFDKSVDESKDVLAFQEEQGRFYLRTGNEKALRIRIEPIEIMKKNITIYKERFTKGYYDPILLKAELVILDAQEGENQWLKGERFALIRDSKIYKSAYGWDSFEEFIKNDTPYARSTVYNWINVYENYTYDQSIKLGSKLSLFTQSIELTRDIDKEKVLTKIENMSLREAKAYITKVEDEKPVMNAQDIQKDTFGEYTPPAGDKDIPTTRTQPDYHEPVEVKMAPAYLKAKSTGTGLLKMDKTTTEALAKRHFSVIIGHDNEILQKYYLQAVQAREGSIRSWIESELAKPENRADLKALKKLQKG